MTGFGRGSAGRMKDKINVEIRTVNSRFFELIIRGMTLEPALESKVKEHVGGFIGRGNVQLRIELNDSQNGQTLNFNKDRFEVIQKILKDIHIEYGQRLNLSEIISTHDLLSADEPETLKMGDLMKAIDFALNQVNEMRSREGEQIQGDIINRLNNLTGLLGKIEDSGKQYPHDKRVSLQEKINTLLGDDSLDENRLIQEVAYLVERADTTEEIVRIHSHFKQFRSYLNQEEPVGRRLNFLIQEVGREVNTIGSKSPVPEVTNKIVEMKDELEKIREQIQNIL